MNLRKNKGITLIALTITIIVLLIIAGISVYSGIEIIKNANLEALKTNMLLIEAKAKEYVEEVSFKMGPTPDENNRANVRKSVYEDEAGLKKGTDSGLSTPSEIPISDATCYYVSTDTMKKWGIDNIELEDGEGYFVKFDETNLTVEVYNNLGYDGKYSLTDIDKIEI